MGIIIFLLKFMNDMKVCLWILTDIAIFKHLFSSKTNLNVISYNV